MRLVIAILVFASVAAVLASTGCSSDAQLRAQQGKSRQKIEELETDLRNEHTKNESLRMELTRQQEGLAQIQQLNDVKDKKFKELWDRYEKLAERAALAGVLPEEMSMALAEFAQANSELLSYDPAKHLIRLESDLTFELASDHVKSDAQPVLAALAEICSVQKSRDYQVIIVGHTDDVPITKPETIARHPTNWHLSVHRAIAVMNILKKSMSEEQLAVMGFGQWRPIAPNQPSRGGNKLNRRVEIFIVPREAIVPSAGIE